MKVKDENFVEFFNNIYPDLETEKKEECFNNFIRASEFAKFLEKHEEKYKDLREENYLEKDFSKIFDETEESEKDIAIKLLNIRRILGTYREKSEKIETSKTDAERVEVLNSLKIHLTEENQLKMDFYIKFMEMHEIISKMKEVDK